MKSYQDKIELIRDHYETDYEIFRREFPLYRTKSGLALANEIKETNPQLVIDLGCGANKFKSIIPNLIGVDVARLPEVDIISDIRELPTLFNKGCADWLLNFGPLNYFDEEWVNEICEVMRYLIKPNGIIVSHANLKTANHTIPRSVQWTDEKIVSIGERFGFKSSTPEWGYTFLSSLPAELKDKWIEVNTKRTSGHANNVDEEKAMPRKVWRWQWPLTNNDKLKEKAQPRKNWRWVPID